MVVALRQLRSRSPDLKECVRPSVTSQRDESHHSGVRILKELQNTQHRRIHGRRLDDARGRRAGSPPVKASSLILASVCACTAVHGASRFEEFTKKFERTTDRAEVVTSTFLGGTGTEWLAGGGFQPDGTIVVAGTALGPELNLGKPAVVLGADGPIQAPVRNVMRGRFNQPEKDKQGNAKLEPLMWDHPNATAFIVRLSPDTKEVRSVTRFGWKAGGLTAAAVDAQGNIYVCGPATPSTASVSKDTRDIDTARTTVRAVGACYLARLSPDASAALWVRTFSGIGNTPDVKIDKAGRVILQNADLRTFDADGKQLAVVTVPGELDGHVAVNPVDGTIARGGEHHWPTGREPYRDPTLNILRPDGSMLHELYNWDGPFVGLNGLRLVSDSAIRGVAYDEDGNLVLHAWSDGGNSVMYREPQDVFTPARKMEGLGLSAWGAGVLSCAYIIKLETKNYTVAAGTLWVGYLHDRNKPNTVLINSMGFARDGSVCVAGSSAWGLIRTGNAFPGDPAGEYVAVMSKDLKSLRYCSTLPGTGQTLVNRAAKWGVISGTVNGRTLVLFLSGATDAEAGKVPLKNATQPQFGGGLSDGHLLLLDLSANTPR